MEDVLRGRTVAFKSHVWIGFLQAGKKLQKGKVGELMGCFQTRLMWGSLGIWSGFQKMFVI